MHDTGSVWYTVLGFLLPVIGLILGFVFKNHKHYRNYKACRKGAIAGFVFIGVILVIFALLLILAVI